MLTLLQSNMACWKMDHLYPFVRFIGDFLTQTFIQGCSIAIFDYQSSSGLILLDLVRWFFHASLVWPDRARRAAYTDAGGLRPQEVRIGMMVLLCMFTTFQESNMENTWEYIIEFDDFISNGFPACHVGWQRRVYFAVGNHPWNHGRLAKGAKRPCAEPPLYMAAWAGFQRETIWES